MGLIINMGISASELELILEQERKDYEREMFYKVKNICDRVVSNGGLKERETDNGDDV